MIKINGEELVKRTIRLLKENGIEDIAISSNNKGYDKFGVPVLKHDNQYNHKTEKGSWLDAYYPTEEPVCYLHGDVYFGEKAVKEIIDAEVNEDLFICTCELNPQNRCGREPLGYKVVNQKRFRKAINDLKSIQGEFIIKPFSWHLYRMLNGLPLKKKTTDFTIINNIFSTNGRYLIISDYTRDIDRKDQVAELEKYLKEQEI